MKGVLVDGVNLRKPAVWKICDSVLKIALSLSLAVGFIPPTHAQETVQEAVKKCAMIVLHGKWGNTNYLKPFGQRMAPECQVKQLEMPWSQRRDYDQSYEVALDEIQAEVRQLRAEGYPRVVLAGHSFGANAGFAYASTDRAPVDAILALAPGHTPAFMYDKGMSTQAVDKARALVASRQPSERVTFDDMNQGRRKTVHIKAEVLLSYFDPKSLGNMSLSAAHYVKPIPTLLVIGNDDPGFGAYRSTVFEKIPAHPNNQYLEIIANHGSTPMVGADAVLNWLHQLP